MSILIIYRPTYSGGNPYAGFKFVKEFGDFLGERLNNIDMILVDFKIHVEDVKDSKNEAFQDLLESLGLIQHVGCTTHQSGHTLHLIIAKERTLFAYQTLWTNFISLTIVLFIQR